MGIGEMKDERTNVIFFAVLYAAKSGERSISKIPGEKAKIER